MSAEGGASSSRILVVEHDEEMALLLGDLLGGAGYEVVTAATLRQAVELLRSRSVPGLLVVDMGSPCASPVLRALKSMPAARPRCIFLTSLGDRAPTLGAAEAGDGACVVKPFAVDRFLQEVTRSLSVPASIS